MAPHYHSVKEIPNLMGSILVRSWRNPQLTKTRYFNRDIQGVTPILEKACDIATCSIPCLRTSDRTSPFASSYVVRFFL